MSTTTKPTFRTKAEQIAAGVESGPLREMPPRLPPLLEAHEAVRDQIEQSPFIKSEKDRRRAAAAADLDAQIDDAIAAHKRDRLRASNQEAGRLRALAANGGDPDAALVVARGQALAAQIGATADPAAVRGLFDDALFTRRDDLIRIAGAAAVTRLSELASRDASKPTAPSQLAYLDVKRRFDDWTRAHPALRQRVEQIEREQAAIVRQIDEAVGFAVQLYGVRRAASVPALKPMPPAEPSRIVEGPAFDRIRGRR